MRRIALAASFVLAFVWWAAAAEPIVILATGQSNVVYRIPYPWEPAPNARSWNWNLTDGNIGTAFVPVQSQSINLSDRVASEVARRHPDQLVHVINIGFFGKSIAHWLPGAPAPDVFANILANVPPALSVAGATRVSDLLWWQGETPTDKPALYPEQFNAVMARFQAQPWFPRATPVTIFGVAPSGISKDANTDYYNSLLRKVAAQDPEVRQFIDTGALGEKHWLDTGHPNGLGFYVIGGMAAERIQR
jgi:Carbohydrate esterase, sialic acid-specific acetylesterase